MILALVGLALALLACVAALFKSKHFADRMAMQSVGGICGLGILILLAVFTQEDSFLDVALMLSAIMFVSTVMYVVRMKRLVKELAIKETSA